MPTQQSSLGMASIQPPPASYEGTESGPPQQPTDAQQRGEKRRNKFGYHRTSVACGHCRRRKVRCIPSPSDTQGRCIHCIRLKKECTFHPVNQQPSTVPWAAFSSLPSTGPKATSAPSPPTTSTRKPAETPTAQSFSPLPPSMAPAAMKGTSTEAPPPIPKVESRSTTNRQYDFPIQPVAGWLLADAIKGQGPKSGDLNATWRPYPSQAPMSAHSSPYTHATSNSAPWTSASSEAASRDDLTWINYPPPERPISDGVETFASHQPTHYPPMIHTRQHERTSVPEMETRTLSGMDSASSLSAGVVLPPNFEGWHQQRNLSSATVCRDPTDELLNGAQNL